MAAIKTKSPGIPKSQGLNVALNRGGRVAIGTHDDASKKYLAYLLPVDVAREFARIINDGCDAVEAGRFEFSDALEMQHSERVEVVCDR